MYLDDCGRVEGRKEGQIRTMSMKTLQVVHNLGWLVNDLKLNLVLTPEFPIVDQSLSRQESPAVDWLRALGLMATMVDVVQSG